MGAPLVETREVSVSYGSKIVLDGLSLAFERGLVHAVVGPTGCGKTTLLHLLAGLVGPKRGSVAFSSEADRNRVALIPQDYGLFPWKTVMRNALMGIDIQNRKRGERLRGTARCERLMEELGIRDLADRWPATLSGGQKQRVAVARALAVEPALLLMDEPFSALDADIREGLQDLLKALPARYGATPVIVTHDIAEALRVADRLIVFRAAAGGGFTAEIGTNDPRRKAETEAALRAALRNARRAERDGPDA